MRSETKSQIVVGFLFGVVIGMVYGVPLLLMDKSMECWFLSIMAFTAPVWAWLLPRQLMQFLNEKLTGFAAFVALLIGFWSVNIPLVRLDVWLE